MFSQEELEVVPKEKTFIREDLKVVPKEKGLAKKI
jgi:hypothetical protein